MVEFGLKLEDNKVSDWSDNYIDYEALKKILKKAKKAQKKYEETCEENPVEAKATTKAYRSGAYDKMIHILSTENLEMPDDASSVAKSSKENLTRILSPIPSEQDLGELDVDEETGLTNEKTALLKHSDSTEMFTSSRIVGAISGIANTMLSREDKNLFERKVRKSLEEIDVQTSAFDDLFYEQQKKVVTFYYSELQQLQQRLESIVEWVLKDQRIGRVEYDTDISERPDAASSERETEVISPFPSHQKRNSSMGEKFEELIMHLTESVRSIGNNENEIEPPGMKVKKRVTMVRMGKVLKLSNKDKQNISGATDDDYDDDEDWDHELMSKAETIRRSLVDQYRIAKLLQNYAMLNVTGFVKIVKKFNKTLPSEDGRYKKALEAHNMLNDAKAVEILSSKYEKYYANWFCNGDSREAKAQMLVKRGDGLDMDWSQLQLGYRMGMCAILALWVCWDLVWGMVAYGKTTIGARHGFPVFRGCGGLLLLQWFWGCSVFMWTRYRVNYIFLFDFNPRIVRTPKEIISDAVDSTLAYLMLMLVSH